MARPGFIALDRITHRVALVGRAIDRLREEPLAGVEVAITSGPAAWTKRLDAVRAGQPRRQPERCVTDGSGFFKYLDLPPGDYVVRAALAGTRYAAGTATATVTTAGAAVVEVALAPTALTGIVNASAPAGPLVMARVRVLDSGEVAYTGDNGSFWLAPLEPGTNRRIEISAQRYVTAPLTVTLATGETTTVPVTTLTRR